MFFSLNLLTAPPSPRTTHNRQTALYSLGRRTESYKITFLKNLTTQREKTKDIDIGGSSARHGRQMTLYGRPPFTSHIHPQSFQLALCLTCKYKQTKVTRYL